MSRVGAKFFNCLHVDVLLARDPSEEPEPVRPTVDPADIRGLATTLRASVGCLPRSRHEGCLTSLFTPSRVTPHRGCASADGRGNLLTLSIRGIWLVAYGVTGTCWAMAHMKAHQFPGDGDHHLIGVFAACTQLPVAFTQAYLRLPTDVLDRLRQLFQARVADGG